ncbi:MAG: hypothetical protein HY842_08860 [Bacteroidetes bacterium]|nr:hypothetical protein [Bacteroidota bacterium]
MIVTSSAIVLTLAVVIVWQSGIISNFEQALKKKDKELVLVSQQRDVQVAENRVLNAKLKIYQDSVAFLQVENQQLKQKIEEQKATILNLNQSIKKQEDRVAKLTTEINRLEDTGRHNEKKINELAQERDKLLVEMEQLDRDREALKKSNEEKDRIAAENKEKIQKWNSKMEAADPAPVMPPAPIINQSPVEPATQSGPQVSAEMENAIKNRQQERLKNVLTKTTVRFSTVSLKNRENGNELKKIKEDGWRFTFIDFDLENIDRESIIDETFILQVFDLDHQVVVPYNEKNPTYPESEMGAIGYKFKYDGKPVSVRYINTQKKEGGNYEIRLIYTKGDLTFKVANGSMKIVENGQVVVR